MIFVVIFLLLISINEGQYILINKTVEPFAYICSECITNICGRGICQIKHQSTTNYRIEMIFLNLDTNETSYGCSDQIPSCNCCNPTDDKCKSIIIDDNNTLCQPIIISDKNTLNQYIVGENYTFLSDAII